MGKRILLCIALGFVCSAASADYRFEGSVGYAEGDGDNVNDIELETVSVSGAAYLDVVAIKQVPLAEAGFLSQASVVRYSYTSDKTKVNSFVTLGVGSGLIPGLGQPATLSTDVERHYGELVYISKASGWFGLLGAATLDGDLDNADLDGKLARVGVGRYVTPTTTVQVFYERSEQDSDSAFSIDCDGQIFCIDQFVENRTETSIDSVGVLARHVGKLFGYHYAAQGLIQKSDSNLDFTTVIQFDARLFGSQERRFQSKSSTDAWLGSLDFTWYLNSNLGLSAGYDFQKVESDRSGVYRLGVGWFARPNIQLRAQFLRRDLDGSRGDIDQISIGITGRI